MYRISEFSAMTGLSPSKIRFYEKHGLFVSKRQENNYRVYTPEDAFRANAFRVLLQYGFTVEQAVEMLDAKQGDSEFQNSLEGQHEDLLRQIDLLNYRRARIESALDLIKSKPSKNFDIVDISDQLYVAASSGADFSISVENEKEIAFFYDLLSVTNCARIIRKDDFKDDRDTIDPSYVVCMPIHEKYRLATDLDKDKIQLLTMGKCLRFTRYLTRTESIKKENFDDMFHYLEDHGYHLRGDSLLLPAFLNLDGKGSDIETLLVPIS